MSPSSSPQHRLTAYTLPQLFSLSAGHPLQPLKYSILLDLFWLHNCYLARTIALTGEEKVFCTRLLAMNFDCNVAMLEVVYPMQMAGDILLPLAVADSVADDGDRQTRVRNCSHVCYAGIRFKASEIRQTQGVVVFGR